MILVSCLFVSGLGNVPGCFDRYGLERDGGTGDWSRRCEESGNEYVEVGVAGGTTRSRPVHDDTGPET